MNEADSALRRAGRATGIAAMIHLVLFQLLSGAILAGAALVMTLAQLPGMGSGLLYICSDAAMLISGLVYLVFWLRNREAVQAQTPPGAEMPVGQLALYLLAVLGVNGLASSVNTLFTALTGLSLTVPALTQPDADPLLLLVTVAVFPAIVEELIFRGFLYRYLRRHGRLFAALASSLVFGLIHLNVLQLLFAFAMGLILCQVYERSGKLRYAMLLHLLNNLLMVLTTAFAVDAAALTIAEGAMGVLFLAWLSVRAVRAGQCGAQLLPAGTGDALRQCGSFLRAIPMLLFVLGCLAVCIWMIFV